MTDVTTKASQKTSEKTSEPTRTEVEARLDAIRTRIVARTDELARIERGQIAAAALGEAPDRALSAQKAALRDEQSIDQQALTSAQGLLDQIDAAEQRAHDLSVLSAARQEAAAKVQALEATAGAIPDAIEQALQALRDSGTGLYELVTRLRSLQAEAGAEIASANALASRLGEPANMPAPSDHMRGLSDALGRDIYTARIFHSAARNPGDAVEALGYAARHTVKKAPEQMRASGFSFSGGA